MYATLFTVVSINICNLLFLIPTLIIKSTTTLLIIIIDQEYLHTALVLNNMLVRHFIWKPKL